VQIPDFSVLTATFMAMTAGLLYFRLNRSCESNWPLFYYLLAVIYAKWFEGTLNDYALYAAVIAALLLRFEFMGGWIIRILQAGEFGLLLYFLYRGVELLMF
jgi:hypothetical protein